MRPEAIFWKSESVLVVIKRFLGDLDSDRTLGDIKIGELKEPWWGGHGESSGLNVVGLNLFLDSLKGLQETREILSV